jgi:hypothetical protein
LRERPAVPLTLRQLACANALGRSRETVELLSSSESDARKAFADIKTDRLGRFFLTLGRGRAALGEFLAAEADLLEAHAILGESNGATGRDRRVALDALVQLYDAWHAAEPEKGYDDKAAEWRDKLTRAQAG